MSKLEQPFSTSRLDAIAARFSPPWRGERLITHREAMLLNYFPPQLEATLASATQANYRKYKPHRTCPTCNILNDWFSRSHFAGKHVLELGPGHYTFSLLAKHFGAAVTCIEKDPVLARLGESLGFEIVQVDFIDQSPADVVQEDKPFDGIWLRGVMNACRFADVDSMHEYVRRLNGLLSPFGWGWATSCNTVPASAGKPAEFVNQRIESQREAFESVGWSVTEVTDTVRTRYRLNFAGCRYIFTRNLPDLNDAEALGWEL